MSEGILVLIATLVGGLIGGVSSFFVTAYKHKKEVEKENKRFKREKLSELHKYLSEAIDDEYKFYDHLRLKTIEGHIDDEDLMPPYHKSYKQIKLLIDLNYQEYKNDYSTISDKRKEMVRLRKDYLLTNIAIKYDKSTKVREKNKREQSTKYYNKITEIESLVKKFQDKLSKKAKQYN